MAELHFYPTVQFDGDEEDPILENAGYSDEDYDFYYRDSNDIRHELKPSTGASSLACEDGSWDMNRDGLWLSKEIRFQYPNLLKGPSGILCRDASLGAAIIWTNSSLKQMGYILPDAVNSDHGDIGFHFEHYFQPGSIADDLSLKLILYVKNPAAVVQADEQFLMNESGVSLGVVDECDLNFKDNHAVFPVKQIHDKNSPLWYLDVGDWEDPEEDLFTEENLCLYLNTYYKDCPTLDNVQANPHLLITILSSAYFILYQKLDSNQLGRVINRKNSFEPGSISEALSFLYGRMEADDKELFDTRKIECQMRAIQNTINGLIMYSLEKTSGKKRKESKANAK